MMREVAFDACCKKNKRVWWAIYLIIGAIATIVGGGFTVAMSLTGTVHEHQQHLAAHSDKFNAADARFDRTDLRLARIEAKIDRLLERK